MLLRSIPLQLKCLLRGRIGARRAGHWRLVHQLMVQSVLLSVTGGVLGLLLARFGVPAILQSLTPGFPLPRLSEISLDRSVVLFTVAVSIACGVVFGIVPVGTPV